MLASCDGAGETWITEEISGTYLELHRLGFAHSVETWQDGDPLAGRQAWRRARRRCFGESMFHRVTDAPRKVALHGLNTRLRELTAGLLDTQWVTPHLRQFGALEIPAERVICGNCSRRWSKPCTFV